MICVEHSDEGLGMGAGVDDWGGETGSTRESNTVAIMTEPQNRIMWYLD